MPSFKGRLLIAVVAVSLLAPAGAAVAQQDEPSPGLDALAASGQLGAVDEAYRDSFDVAPAWLDLGEDESGRTAIEDGRAFLSVVGPDANFWDYVELPVPAEVMRVETTVELDGGAGTAAGPACGSAVGLPRWFVAGVNGGDEWWLGRLIDGRLQVVDRGKLASDPPSGSSHRVAIECASVPTEGGDHVLISVDDRLVAASMPVLDIPVGPYDKAGLLIATDAPLGSATFDDLIVHTGER